MTPVSSDERAAFFKQHFGVTGDQVITERKHAPFLQIGTAEYRAAHRALPAGPKRPTFAELDARLARLLTEVDESERRFASLGL